VIIITGDHGEGLGDHGVRTHFNTVFDSEVHTLGLMYLPGVGGRQIDQPAAHRDMITTALNVLGVKREFERLRGRNFVPALRGFRVEPDELFVELAGVGVRSPIIGLVRWPFKMVHTVGSSSFALYDLARDPMESRDVAAEHPRATTEMRERMIRHVEGIVHR
jgi:arylsulfatase A-like enzyme